MYLQISHGDCLYRKAKEVKGASTNWVIGTTDASNHKVQELPRLSHSSDGGQHCGNHNHLLQRRGGQWVTLTSPLSFCALVSHKVTSFFTRPEMMSKLQRSKEAHPTGSGWCCSWWRPVGGLPGRCCCPIPCCTCPISSPLGCNHKSRTEKTCEPSSYTPHPLI